MSILVKTFVILLLMSVVTVESKVICPHRNITDCVDTFHCAWCWQDDQDQQPRCFHYHPCRRLEPDRKENICPRADLSFNWNSTCPQYDPLISSRWVWITLMVITCLAFMLCVCRDYGRCCRGISDKDLAQTSLVDSPLYDYHHLGSSDFGPSAQSSSSQSDDS